jgi:hypothetical protein
VIYFKLQQEKTAGDQLSQKVSTLTRAFNL